MKFKHIHLLRSRPCRTVTAYGAHFVVFGLPNHWHAVAYLQMTKPRDSNPRACSSQLHKATFSTDYWRDQLAVLSDGWSDTIGKRVIKFSDKGLVTQFDMDIPSVGNVGIVCKQGAASRFAQKIGTYFKAPKEWREFWMGHQLLQMNMPTPMPLACMWRRAGVCHFEARIVTEFIADASPLDQAIRQIISNKMQFSSRKVSLEILTNKTIELICDLGQHGFYHRDLKASNIMVSNVDDNPQPWLIDLDGLDTEKNSLGPKFKRSLVRLVLSLTEISSLTRADLLRGLKSLLIRPNVTPENWKVTWREIQTEAEKLAAKQRRRRKEKLAGYE